MAADITFKSWVLEPGNYRLVQSIKNRIKELDVCAGALRTWADFYTLWEQSVERQEESKALFKPIFDLFPPTRERGATERQLLLYRGQTTVLQEPASNAAKLITYRGRQHLSQKTVSEAEKPKKARYYRGALVQ